MPARERPRGHQRLLMRDPTDEKLRDLLYNVSEYKEGRLEGTHAFYFPVTYDFKDALCWHPMTGGPCANIR